MTAGTLIVPVVCALISYVNGANDVSKGIATLVGSGVTNYRRAVLWGTGWTALGGLAAVAWGSAMAATFGGGLLGAGTTATFPAVLATIVGATAWILIATRRGLPVSTTHAIVGSLAGVSVVAYGADGIRWGAVGAKVLLPLVLSPVAALAIVALLLRVARSLREPQVQDEPCLCADVEPAVAVAAIGSGVARSAILVPTGMRLRLFRGRADACAREAPEALQLRIGHLHWLTSGVTSLARALNDAPKMAALAVAAAALDGGGAASMTRMVVLVTLGMVAGSLVAGLRVTRVLAEDITALDDREGFVANLVTSSLVVAGALGGLPMSTTHVATGAIVGAGAQRTSPSVNRRVVGQMLLAWVVTLPAAAVLGVVSYALMVAL